MNIGIACDKNYLFLYKSMLRSLAENNRHVKEEINVYFLNSDLSAYELQAFVDWCNSIEINLKRIKIDSDLFPQDIDSMQFQGFGGTNFDVAVSAFTGDAENQIIFTDGYADMPHQRCDAIWIVYGNMKISPPGGTVLYIRERGFRERGYR